MLQALEQGECILIKYVRFHTDVWIISDGRNYGASGFIGELLAKHKQKSKHRDNSDEDDWLVVRPNDPVLIGISHWGSLKRKELLYGISVSHILVNNGEDVSKITVHFCFCQNFVKFPPTLISFGR